MDYYKVNTDPTKSPTKEFADLVDFYQSGGQHEEPVNVPSEAPVSRRSSEPVSKKSSESHKPASTPAKTSAPEKPAGFFASLSKGFHEGLDKVIKRDSDSDSDEKKKTSIVTTAEEKVSGVLQKADKAVASGVQKVDRIFRKV